jgi:hypothetical protein
MVSITSQQWSDLFSKPIAVGLLLYLLVGFILAWVIVARGMKLRRPPTGGMLWEKKDHARNVLFLFQAIVVSIASYFCRLHHVLAARASLALGQPR